MFFAVIIELGPFLFMYAILNIFFTLFQIILLVEVPDGDQEYPGVHPYLRVLIQTLRISVGDLQVSTYNQWTNERNLDKSKIQKLENNDDSKYLSITQRIIVSTIWIIWVLDIYLILIVMLNLLIAQVGQIYDKIMSQIENSIYKERAQLNLKIFQLLHFLGLKNEFVALIMQTPLKDTSNFKLDDFITFTERIKKSTQNIVGRMGNNVQNKIYMFENNINQKVIDLKQYLISLENNSLNHQLNIEKKLEILQQNYDKQIELLKQNIENKFEEILENQKNQQENQKIVNLTLVELIKKINVN